MSLLVSFLRTSLHRPPLAQIHIMNEMLTMKFSKQLSTGQTPRPECASPTENGSERFVDSPSIIICHTHIPSYSRHWLRLPDWFANIWHWKCNCVLQSPEIQTMYSLNLPVSAIRTKIRQQFEQHRYVSQINVVDVLLYKSHSEFQVSIQGILKTGCWSRKEARRKKKANDSLLPIVGNVELLEAAFSRHEVLPSRGRARC